MFVTVALNDALNWYLMTYSSKVQNWWILVSFSLLEFIAIFSYIIALGSKIGQYSTLLTTDRFALYPSLLINIRERLVISSDIRFKL